MARALDLYSRGRWFKPPHQQLSSFKCTLYVNSYAPAGTADKEVKTVPLSSVVDEVEVASLCHKSTAILQRNDMTIILSTPSSAGLQFNAP